MRSPASDYEGRRALVLGLGRFGGGLAATRFLRERGALVTISDHAARSSLAEPARAAEALGATLVFGPQTPALLDGHDLVVASPALPFDHPVLEEALARGIELATETNLFLERVRAPVFGVTGTKGKSTTSTLLARLLGTTGRRVHLGGNVGNPLLASVDAIGEEDLVVLELSSFQLYWTRRVGLAPHLTLVTNLFGDHLDRHGTFDHYARSKRAALDQQRPGDVAVLPGDDPDVRRAGYLTAGPARRVLFGEGAEWTLDGARIRGPGATSVSLDAFPLWGAHNRRNALAAVAAAFQSRGLLAKRAERALAGAEPLPHRLAPVREVAGVLFVDDSNATNPTSTIRALESCPRPAVVLVGGKDKGLDVTPLVAALERRARAVVGIGSTGPDIVRRCRDHVLAEEGGPDLESAVRLAAGLARPGDAVLLSPAYSSLDQYASFVERGLRFQRAVEHLDAP